MRLAYAFLCSAFIGNSAPGGPAGFPADSTSPVGAGQDSVFQVGEELTYNVTYASFDIGQVRIKLLDAVRTNGRTTFKATAYIDSYRGIPFVNLHTVYENSFDEDIYSTWFSARQKKDRQWISYVYTFDYPKQLLTMERGVWKSGVIDWHDTLHLDSPMQDGLSLFFFARRHVMSVQHISVPTVVNEKRGTTVLAFNQERTRETINALDYPVDVVHFEGEAGFVGIFGLTGGFEGWFSNDAARVPIVATMRVLIGNVRIELMKWNRTGWNPPRSPEDAR